MDFTISAEQGELRRRILEFAREHLHDRAASPVPDTTFPRDHWRHCASLGILGLPFPEVYGGGGRDALTTVMALEALGQGCADNGLIFAIGAQMWSVQMPILRFGSEEQKHRYLPALCCGDLVGAHAMSEAQSGSDAFSISTSARRIGQGYRLNGTKVFVSQAPVADVFVVFARTGSDPGPMALSAFLVDRSTPGLVVGPPTPKLGLRTSPMASLTFDDCVIPESSRLNLEGRGAQIFRDSIEWERSCILAGAVGAMDRLLNDATKYARERHQFGRAIAAFGAIAHRLIDMKIHLEQARLALYRAAWEKEHGSDGTTLGAIAKLVVSEAYRRCAILAMEIRGGYGYTTDDVEREVRDALGSTIYSGTSDIQRLVIGRSLGLKLT
ncbi:L-prolyl-PCP dehydrogenase [Planctomycetaceae bacterium]|nr:L-prolyl-PCP dehydrogenase [Planctomycetaceae bacterium]